MSQRVLVFDSDAAFADDVKQNFERMGLEVDVANDGPSGLEIASAHPPSLILLSIELPGMNGFLVCKKIKKMAELEHVPLVIMSSEVDQETFEQHKKLRTRADEYIRKPIEFPALLDRVRSYVSLNGHASALMVNGSVAPQADAGLDIEQAFSVSDEEVLDLREEPTGTSSRDLVSTPGEPDPELVALSEALPSDSALPIGGDTGSKGGQGLGGFVMPEPVSTNTNASSGFPEKESVPSLRSVSQHVTPRSSTPPFIESAAQAAAHAAEIERWKRELAAAEEKVQAAERRAVLAEQRASGMEKSLDAAKRTGGASSRELLDLREQLNRKERELLELRDQVTARDKHLIEASDRTLSVERELQDLRDNHSDLQRELEKKSEVVIALTGDKESARKRLDDAKARAERNEAKVRELSASIDELRVAHQLELDSLNGAHAEALVSLRTEHSTALEQRQQQHVSEVAALNTRHSAELSEQARTHALELSTTKDQHATQLADRDQSHRDELSEVREEYSVAQKAAADRAEQEKAAALEVLREELNAAHYERLTDTERELRAAHVAEREELERRNTTAVSELTDKHRYEVSQLNKSLADAGARHALLEEQHEETVRARDDLDARLQTTTAERDQLSGRSAELAAQLSRAQARVERDHELIDRVRKAMAIGLGLLEEQKHEPAR
ncbi:MAG: response regulator [Polyangiales bacterium]